MKKRLLYITLLMTAFAYSQKTIVASGGNSTGNGSVSYSVGQLIYTSNFNSEGSVSQGIQQGFEFFSLSNADFKELSLEAKTYPNPTKNTLNLVLKNLNLKELSYKLYDIKGLEVSKGKVIAKSTAIGMSKMAKGVYVLKINNKNKQLKTFKIIKK